MYFTVNKKKKNTIEEKSNGRYRKTLAACSHREQELIKLNPNYQVIETTVGSVIVKKNFLVPGTIHFDNFFYLMPLDICQLQEREVTSTSKQVKNVMPVCVLRFQNFILYIIKTDIIFLMYCDRVLFFTRFGIFINMHNQNRRD